MALKNFLTTYKNPVTVVLVLIVMGGLFAYNSMQTSLFPEITFPKIKIIADAGLQPVDKMMITVTKPLENAIKQIPDLQMIRSTTSRGSCEISAFINWNANVDLSLQQIQSKINEINNQLPPETQITVAKMNPSILPVMGYSIECNNLSPIQLKMLANYTVKPFLSQVKGVSEVRVIGGKAKEYWIKPDIQKMSALGITPDIMNASLSATNFVKSNGYLADYKYLYLTVTDATAHSLQDIENTVIRNDGKRIITVKDVAAVAVQESVEYTKINANGHDGILIAIIKQPGANLIQLSKDVAQQIELLQSSLPKGVSIKPYYVQADFVNDSIKSVSDSLWIGLALAIVVAVIFLRSLKASATILITIPLTLLLTMMVLYCAGYTLNIMTLGAIAAAIGLIIDDAIVVVEQIHRTHEEHPEVATKVLLPKAIRYLLPAMIGSSMSTIVIFVPFVLMSGVAGAYFKVLTNTMIITLICSFFVTWLGLPIVYMLLSRKHNTLAENRKTHEVKKQRWVSFFIHRTWISISFCALLILLTVWVLPQLQTGFLPEMDEGSIVLDYSTPPGTSLQETDRILKEVEKIIRRNPDVAAYSRRTGTQMGFFITEPNRGDYLIQLKKARTKTTEAISGDIRQQIESTQPALRVDFGQVITDMLGDLMTSVQPVEVKIFGNDQKQLQGYAAKVANVISHVKGTADVFDGVVIAGPSVSIAPNYAKLAQYGLTPVGFQYQVQMALEGNVVGNIQEQQQLTPLRMLYPNSNARSVADIMSLRIFLPNGKLNPIADLATVSVKPGDAEIQRENLQSVGVVTARLDGRDLGSAISEIQQKIKASIVLPQGYHIEYGGAYAEQQQSFRELLMILALSCLLVFGVILFLFKTFRIACAILFIALLGIAGSYLALFLTHTPLNVGSYTGVIMIVGIIGENAIFTFLQFKEAIKTSSVDEAIVYSISTRLRPKLMTSLGAIIALLPLALGIGAGAQLHQPLAIAVIGGFIVALPLLIVVFPSLLRLLFLPKG